jgi:hypothetical protein
MSVSIKTYITNIIDVLVKVVLPNVNSAFARIQLSFAIDILNQLQNQMEYRNDVMRDDYKETREMLDMACAVLNDHHINLPEKLSSSAGRTSSGQTSISDLSEELAQIETDSAKALDLMYEKRNEIENFNEIENKLLDLSLHYVRRKGKLRAPTINLELLESM